MPRTLPTLSLKQPWAALLVHGLKTIEVRAWGTELRGWTLIHASKQEDERPAAWKHVGDDVAATTQLRGGILGAAKLVHCIAYRRRPDFAADRQRHLNQPSWFRPPVLYGFIFQAARVLPFRKVPGWVKFFEVDAAGYRLP
jgi:ASCH domain-containing protein